ATAAIDHAATVPRQQLVVMLVVFLASLVTLIVLAIEVTHHGSLTLLDDAIAAEFHRMGTAQGYAIFGFVTDLGAPATVGFVGLIGIAMLSARREWVVASGWAVALGGGAVIDEALKYAIARPRPVFAAEHLTHLSYSFPSGHSIGSCVGYGMLAYVILLRVHRRDAQVLVVALTALLVLAVGFSRLYLDVHYFSDVLGGYAAGSCWLCIVVTSTDVVRRRVVPRRGRGSAAAPR
ncbi:MAG TPA: phosphatase PAP2 family protein, partial [Gemmatimonadaceae bacterium]